jgi:prepilin-type N-terminal cleavage/methylation domain-containing protein
MTMQRESASRLSLRGFSILELLTVIAVVAIVLAIVLPALGAGRDAARKAATTAMLTELGNASSQFEQDERRLPGYFTTRDMGSEENAQRGWSAMNNVLVDLAGGRVNASGGNTIEVGPTPTKVINLDVSQIGSNAKGSLNKGYFKPDGKMFVLVNKPNALDEHRQVPDLVDPWGTPILAWAKNDFAKPDYQNSSTSLAFAEINSSEPTKRPFTYWSANAVFLTSQALGRSAGNQVEDSWIGSGRTENEIRESLTGLLGALAYPDPTTIVNANDPGRPSQMRAPLVFHAAGPDFVFLGKSDAGGRVASTTGGVQYNVKNEDVAKSFNDIVIGTGN